MGRNIARLQGEIKSAFDTTVHNYSVLFRQNESILREFVSIEFNLNDEEYSPTPIIKQHEAERDVTMYCNLPAYLETWEPLVGSVDGATEEDSQMLYTGVGMAWVGLANMAVTAKEKRKQGIKSKELQTIMRIQKKMEDAEQVTNTITELEIVGKIEPNLYPVEISDEELNRINRLRYGIGVGFLINDTPEKIREGFSLQCAENLSTYFNNMGTHLIDFALSWGLDKKVEPDQYKQQGISRAWHTLYFAGIRPMDISDIL